MGHGYTLLKKEGVDEEGGEKEGKVTGAQG